MTRREGESKKDKKKFGGKIKNLEWDVEDERKNGEGK